MNGRLLAVCCCGAAILLRPAYAVTWFTFGGHEYGLTDSYGTWAECQAEASSLGAYLAAISSESENAWITETFRDAQWKLENNSSAGYAAWIGYLRTSTNASDWQWTNGEPVVFTKYAWNFPYGGVHAYIHTGNHWDPSVWNANSAHDSTTNPDLNFKGVMERETSSVPAPAAVLSFVCATIGQWIKRRLR